ncbi:MAG: TetR/AcrR family transcriptional regulator [Clostridia bacterium]|nr:TetR/AcrR family transcriptional regulator [Clostridia bacterium]
MDRRNRKTEEAFTSALFYYLEKKDLNRITVKELCEYADMNRGTFYLHYLDIYDLLERTEQTMISAVFNVPSNDLRTAEDSVFATFRYVRDHKREYRIMFNANTGFMNKLRNIMIYSSAERLKRVIPNCNDSLARIVSTIYIGGATSLLEYWVTEDDCQTDPSTLLASLDQITKYIYEHSKTES